jgi:thymidylate kinase
LEGVDGAGKTTLARELALALSQAGIGARVLLGVPSPFSEIRERINRIEDVDLRYLFYMACNKETSRLAREMLKQHYVICDRYVYSTLAYHEAFGANTAAVDVEALQLLVPDFAFLVTVDEATRRSRLQERGSLSATDLRSHNQTFRDTINEEYRKFRLFEIDNSCPDVRYATTMMVRVILEPGRIPLPAFTRGIASC